MSEQMNKLAVISLLILCLFIHNIRSDDVTTFGINPSEIPRLYIKFFVENENWSEDYIQWQIGAFMVDKFILNEIYIINGLDEKNEKIKEFELKYKEYKKLKKKRKNTKFGWEQVWELYSELISDEYLEGEILIYYEFEEEKWKKIKEIQNWEEMKKEEQNEIIEENLKLLIKKLHQNEMEKLLVNLEEDKKGVKKYNQSELSKAIQEMNNDSNNKNITPEEETKMEKDRRHKFEIMKERMRKMVGAEWTFKHLEKTEPILMRFDTLNKEKIEQMFLENYLEIFSPKNEMSREKAATSIFILDGVKYLDRQFGKAEKVLKEEWTEKYRPMFSFYFEQMEDLDWDSCKNNGIIYRNMLYKLRKFMKEGKWKTENLNLYKELESDFTKLKGNLKAEIDDKTQEMEMLKEENTKIILKLRRKFPELKAAIDARQLENEEQIFLYLINGSRKIYDFLETYKNLITESDDKNLNFWKEKVNFDATFWHYKNIYDNLFEESIMDLKNSQIQSLNENSEGKKQKLCKLQYFFENSLVNNEEIKNLNILKDFKDLPKFGNVSCDDIRKVNIISSLIVMKQTVETKKKIYFDYLDWLISNFEEFQQFLMKLDSKFKLNIINILNVEKKDGIEKFELFGKLEKKHPKWLKIDEMYLDMRMELYKSILKTKEYLPESMISQRRIAMTFLVWEMKKAQNASEKCGIGILYPEDFKMIKEKIDKLLEEIYEKRGENFDSMENICILTRFRQLIKMEYIEEQNEKENLINEYKSDLCKEENAQHESWEHQKKLFEAYHSSFIFTGEYRFEYEKLIKKLGGIIRLKLLMPESMEKGNIVFNIKDFSMDSILREHFSELLNTKNEEEDKITNNLALNFFSWARHIDKKLENMEKAKKSKTKPKILVQIWWEKRLYLLNKYDELGNTINSLYLTAIILARFHLDILKVIEKAEKEVFSKEKLKEIFNQIFEEWRYEEHNKEWEEYKEEKIAEYSNTIQIFIQEELAQQFNNIHDLADCEERINFRRNFIERLQNDKAANQIFLQVIGKDGVKKVFNQHNEIQKGNKFATKTKTTNTNKDKQKTLLKKEPRIIGRKLIEMGMSSSDTGEKFEDPANVPTSPKNPSVIEFIHAIGNESAEMSGIASNSMLNSNLTKDSELHGQSQNLMDDSQHQQHSNILHLRDSLENVPSSPKISSAAGTKSPKSSIIASNPMLNSNIIESTDSKLHAQKPNLMDQSQRQQHSTTIIHSKDSELHSDKRVEINKQTEIESKEIIGDLSDFKEEDQRKKIIKKNRNSQKSSRQSKKERKLRKIAEDEEMLQEKAREKAEAKIKEKAEAKAKEEEEAKAKKEAEAKAKKEEEANRKQSNENLIIEKLKELLKNKGYGEFGDSNELNQSEYTILEIMDILVKWNEESRLLISGSMQLKLNSADSDIDLIVLLPYEPSENWQNEFDKNFMGDFETKCVEKKCENGDKISLYCFLCQAEKVFLLEKINSQVPIIKMQFKRNIPIDINMALVPKELLRNFPTIEQQQQEKLKYYEKKKKMEKILEYQPSLTEIDELIRSIINGIGAEHLRMSIGDKRNGMIFTLSGYRSNKQIAHLLTKEKNDSRNVNITVKNYDNFRIAYLALKLWVKNHFIYSSIFGFFNGTTLTVMICKLAMELGENASAIIIIEQFFQKYHKNGNELLEEIHLEFDKNDQEIRNELDWTKEKEAWRGNSWKVITPGFPTQNAAFQIIPPSDRIINTELGNGLKKVSIFRKLIQPSAETKTINEKLANLFTAQKFENKYSHFVAIVCKYPSENANGPEFCNQIKIGSLHLINSQQIDYFHIKPERIINKRICPKQFQIENEEKLCTIWLAGIKMKNNINAENVDLDSAINWKERSEELITYRWKLHEEYKFFDATLHYFSKEDLLKWLPPSQQKN